MPRRPSSPSSDESLLFEPEQSVEAHPVVLPETVRNDLLLAQQASLPDTAKLPRLKIMNGGVGFFEFDDEPGVTYEQVTAIALGFRAHNVLWDRRFEDVQPDEQVIPACVSVDARLGKPRQDFMHAGLFGAAAQGTEEIECTGCPYNEWGSASLVGRGVQGSQRKACNNHRTFLLWVPSRAIPVEFTCPVTSITAADEYVRSLTRQNIPLPTVLTILRQERKESGRMRWAQATFMRGEAVPDETFAEALALRQRFLSVLAPAPWDGRQDRTTPDF